MTKRLLVLFFCLFLVMIGFGSTELLRQMNHLSRQIRLTCGEARLMMTSLPGPFTGSAPGRRLLKFAELDESDTYRTTAAK